MTHAITEEERDQIVATITDMIATEGRQRGLRLRELNTRQLERIAKQFGRSPRTIRRIKLAAVHTR